MERKYLLWLFVITLVGFAGAILGYALSQSYFSNLDTRMAVLEEMIKKERSVGQEIKMDEVRVLIAKSEESLKDKTTPLLYFGLPFALFAIIASVFGAYKWAAELGKERAMEAFKDMETILKESKSILVLTENADDKVWMSQFLQSTKFWNVKFALLSEIQQPENRFDLVILVENEEKTLEEEKKVKDAALTAGHEPPKPSPFTRLNPKIAECFDKQVARSYFYFGKARAKHDFLDNQGSLSFANSRSQLYSNIINALRLQTMR